jgi:hypothetical protein
MKAFSDSRRYFWLGGVLVLFVGLLVALLVLPATSRTPGAEQPDIHVPKMENVPPPEVPRMQLPVNQGR